MTRPLSRAAAAFAWGRANGCMVLVAVFMAIVGLLMTVGLLLGGADAARFALGSSIAQGDVMSCGPARPERRSEAYTLVYRYAVYGEGTLNEYTGRVWLAGLFTGCEGYPVGASLRVRYLLADPAQSTPIGTGLDTLLLEWLSLGGLSVCCGVFGFGFAGSVFVQLRRTRPRPPA